MIYENIVEAIFIERPNRFIAHCIVNGKEEVVHVKNTGKCRELLIPGCKVYLQEHDNPKRKTKFSLISVIKENRLINMDSQAPNKVAYEALINNKINLPGLKGDIKYIKPEKTYGDSRFDIYIETDTEKAFLEVKGVTLEEDGIVLFPDAKTERGVKHINELIKAIDDGYLSYILFVIQMDNVKYFTPNIKMHKEFGQALKNAQYKGVNILAYDCDVTLNSLDIKNKVDIVL
ncbi:DNA/RNA nuclease SfsA [Paraclostridium sordellii]|uniref:Sugar fermentation stimulation protein homolog n=1 Tax=Paraclostridium sordellii TaxID=1505 RepID=A0A0C7G7Z7_PARSO|nr:DNA/RNA nuclease SfsA [Paeniclostridium sordellii]QYE96585.1 DNA/RNA nuclease SfsA [Paeniclostridium sordellii]CEN78624.1 sugar fermentation stimulation protein [[Clostridium] sordellii] [Paeniclostridium sordellii]CEO09120.1 sugar fermentation stimulation protein [[Clostridium] sordellii] [Paeniclostridium sordellii]CEP87448.1 sugar fermentation stimulation protein [[Clostridium] sordellii] [Paeniclostridium sordellii]CEP95786.1 sugar fermentation stimulation protein [[Clostridium] sordell